MSWQVFACHRSVPRTVRVFAEALGPFVCLPPSVCLSVHAAHHHHAPAAVAALRRRAAARAPGQPPPPLWEYLGQCNSLPLSIEALSIGEDGNLFSRPSGLEINTSGNLSRNRYSRRYPLMGFGVFDTFRGGLRRKP